MNIPNMVRRGRTLAGFAVLCVLAGCGQGPNAEFSYRDSTQELIPTAQKALEKTLVARFGTPQELVAWERMPVHYGGVKAAVAAVPDPYHLQLALPEPEDAEAPMPPIPALQPGESILWLTGAHAGDNFPHAVAGFEPKTLLLTLRSPVEPTPPAGTQLVAGFGSQLQLGRTVYMKNCVHCHGVAGDATGPTAKYLNPLPRDFRLGVIKFTSTLPPERSTREDMYRTISHGIPGTYMPSFLLLPEEHKAAVIEYVHWLSMRGELEKRMGDELSDYNAVSIAAAAQEAKADYDAAVKRGETPEAKPVSEREAKNVAATEFATYEKDEFSGILDETADFIAEAWVKAEDPSSLIVPNLARVEDSPESRLRGRLLYMGNRTKCYTCHGPLGRGDGAATEDFWPKPGTNDKYAARGLHDLWGHKLQPRDLTKGQYRGGRRPIDLYRRVFAGIKGTPMPAFGGTVLKDEEIWDLVNYVMSIPFEPASPIATPATMASVPHSEQDDR